MEHKFHTYQEAHDAGYRGVKGDCRDVTPPADGYGYRFENDDGERTVTVWFSEEKTTMGAVGVYRPMFLPRVAAAAALLGRKGGSARSERKAATSAANGRKGGRPIYQIIRAVETESGWSLVAPDGNKPQEGFCHASKSDALQAASQLWPTNSAWKGKAFDGGWRIKIN